MDSNEIFRRLTRGIKFAKQKKPVLSTETTETAIESKKGLNVENNPVKMVESKNLLNENNQSNFEFISPALADELSDKRYKKTAKKLSRSKPPSDEELIRQKKQQEIQSVRDKYQITVFGKYIPAPLNNFEELNHLYGVDDNLLENMNMCNYKEPTPIQRQALPILLECRSILACAPTGSGKTLAFLLPILHNLGGPKKEGFRALVIAPTRELTQQIYRECVRLSVKTGLKIHIVVKVEETQQKFSSANGKHCDILISTPKGIITLLEQQPPVLDMSR